MKNWKDVKDVVTPGGDPAWICPHCGEKLKYPWGLTNEV